MAKGSDRLKLEEQIADAIERQVASVETLGDVQKKVRENLKTIHRLEVEIAEVGEGEMADALKAQVVLLKTVNSELSKGKNYLKTTVNQTKSYGKELIKTVLPSASSIWELMLGIEDATKKTAANVGLYGGRYKVLSASIEVGKQSMIGMGFAQEDAIKAQQALSDETGRQVILSEEAYDAIAITAKMLGKQPDEVAKMAAQMDKFGLGTKSAVKVLSKASEYSQEMGVHQGNVLKNLEGSLSLLNKMDFKGGVKGLAKMAAFSEKYKLSMESVAAVSEKVFRPEGAIEAAAQLQVLGGSLAQLGDPMQLMYKARYAPEELAKSITKAATASAVFNEKTGEFDVNALELDRMREAAKALGMDYTELVQTAKQSAKIKMFENALSHLDKKDRELVSGMAEMENGKGQITFVNKLGTSETKLLSELTPGQVDFLRGQKISDEKRAKEMMSINDEYARLVNTLKEVGLQYLKPLANYLGGKEFKEGFDSFMDGAKILMGVAGTIGKHLGPSGILATIFLGKTGLWKLPFWYARGLMIGKGMDVGASKGSFLSKITGGLLGKKGPGTSPAVETKPLSGSQSLGMGKGSMMKSLGSATTIIAMGLAMMMLAKSVDIFADAMIKFKEGDIGWKEIGMGLSFIGVGMLGLGIAAALLTATGAPLVLLAMGAAMLMMGGAVWLMSDGLTKLLGVLSMDAIEPLMLLGPALGLIGLGMVGLAAGMSVLGVVMTTSGVPALLGLTALTLILPILTEGLDSTAKSIKSIGVALGGITTDSLDGLDSLASAALWLSMASLGGDIDVNLGDLTVKGGIDIKGGDSSATTKWIDDPIFITKLTDKIYSAMQSPSR